MVLIICLGGVADANDRWSALTQPVFQTIEHNSRPLEEPVLTTAQDRDGYIWIVSDNRLLRWDAYQLIPIHFQTTQFNYCSLPINGR